MEQRGSAISSRMEELCRNCNIGKYRHFNAAQRAKRLNDRLGIPVVLINIALGSVFFVALNQELPDFAKWTGGFLALGAALISGVSTFFNFGKQFEGHREIGNNYVELAAKCETVLARFKDGLIDVSALDSVLRDYQDSYADINDQAKGFPTTERDFRVALASEKLRSQRRDTRD